jgi:MerR family redox-sensitive transcriptional activator SoxR
MRIGELADRTGLNASALRYYERRGLITASHRIGGQRRYPDDIVYPVILIRFASDMGFTLDEVKGFLNGLRDRAPVGPRWRKLAQRKIKEINANIQRSNQLKSLLEHLLECRCGSLQLCVERLRLSPALPLIARLRNEPVNVREPGSRRSLYVSCVTFTVNSKNKSFDPDRCT